MPAVFHSTQQAHLHALLSQEMFYVLRPQTDIVNGAHPGAGARIAYTRAMSDHRCFPQKRLSTHAMHFK